MLPPAFLFLLLSVVAKLDIPRPAILSYFASFTRLTFFQVPDDDRAQEIGYAASFLVLVGSDFSWEGVGQVMHYDTTVPTVIGAVTAAAVAIDVWKRAGSTSKMVLNGMNRLFLKDVERESRAEAGAFLTAYVTGLPCFAFQPSAVEALR